MSEQTGSSFFRIRAFSGSERDWAGVVRLEECFDERERFDRRVFQRFLWLSHVFLVAETLEESVAGYILGILRSSECEIVSLVVDPSFRRKGVATALILRLLEESGEAEVIRLNVRITNVPALKLYVKMGFELTRVCPGYYPDGVDSYLMTLSREGDHPGSRSYTRRGSR